MSKPFFACARSRVSRCAALSLIRILHLETNMNILHHVPNSHQLIVNVPLGRVGWCGTPHDAGLCYSVNSLPLAGDRKFKLEAFQTRLCSCWDPRNWSRSKKPPPPDRGDPTEWHQATESELRGLQVRFSEVGRQVPTWSNANQSKPPQHP